MGLEEKINDKSDKNYEFLKNTRGKMNEMKFVYIMVSLWPA